MYLEDHAPDITASIPNIAKLLGLIPPPFRAFYGQVELLANQGLSHPIGVQGDTKQAPGNAPHDLSEYVLDSIGGNVLHHIDAIACICCHTHRLP